MGKYELAVKVAQIQQFAEERKFKKAAALMNTIDIRQVKAVSDLNTFAEVYVKTEQFTAAKAIYLKLYKKRKTKRILYRLINLAIRTNELEEAEQFYNEFTRLSRSDRDNYILRYRIDKAKGEPVGTLIETLEKLKEEEYIEEWAYELAKLYQHAGRYAECRRECDDIKLWFGEGEVVDRADMMLDYLDGDPRLFYEDKDFTMANVGSNPDDTGSLPEMTEEFIQQEVAKMKKKKLGSFVKIPKPLEEVIRNEKEEIEEEDQEIHEEASDIEEAPSADPIEALDDEAYEDGEYEDGYDNADEEYDDEEDQEYDDEYEDEEEYDEEEYEEESFDASEFAQKAKSGLKRLSGLLRFGNRGEEAESEEKEDDAAVEASDEEESVGDEDDYYDEDAAPVGDENAYYEESAAPMGGEDVYYEESAAPMGGEDVYYEESAAPMGGEDVYYEESAAPVGGEDVYYEESAAPVGGEDVYYEESAASMGGEDVYYEESAASMGGEDVYYEESAAPVGGEDVYYEESAAPMGGENVYYEESAAPIGGEDVYYEESAAPEMAMENEYGEAVSEIDAPEEVVSGNRTAYPQGEEKAEKTVYPVGMEPEKKQSTTHQEDVKNTEDNRFEGENNRENDKVEKDPEKILLHKEHKIIFPKKAKKKKSLAEILNDPELDTADTKENKSDFGVTQDLSREITAIFEAEKREQLREKAVEVMNEIPEKMSNVPNIAISVVDRMSHAMQNKAAKKYIDLDMQEKMEAESSSLPKEAVEMQEKADDVSDIEPEEVAAEQKNSLEKELETPDGMEEIFVSKRDKIIKENDEEVTMIELEQIMPEPDMPALKQVMPEDSPELGNQPQLPDKDLPTTKAFHHSLEDILTLISGESEPKHFVLVGEESKKVLGFTKKIVKIMNGKGFLSTKRIACIHAEQLNEMDLLKVCHQIKGNCLLIEEAAKLNFPTITKIFAVMDAYHGDFIVVLSDEGYTLDKLFKVAPAMAHRFEYVIDISNFEEKDFD